MLASSSTPEPTSCHPDVSSVPTCCPKSVLPNRNGGFTPSAPALTLGEDLPKSCFEPCLPHGSLRHACADAASGETSRLQSGFGGPIARRKQARHLRPQYPLPSHPTAVSGSVGGSSFHGRGPSGPVQIPVLQVDGPPAHGAQVVSQASAGFVGGIQPGANSPPRELRGAWQTGATSVECSPALRPRNPLSFMRTRWHRRKGKRGFLITIPCPTTATRGVINVR